MMESVAGLSTSWQVIVSSVLATVASVAAYIVKLLVSSGRRRMELLDSNLEKIDVRLDDHDIRISTIEATYLKREDLEEVVGHLQEDLRTSFDRAHSRIDELYSKLKG